MKGIPTPWHHGKPASCHGWWLDDAGETSQLLSGTPHEITHEIANRPLVGGVLNIPPTLGRRKLNGPSRFRTALCIKGMNYAYQVYARWPSQA